MNKYISCLSVLFLSFLVGCQKERARSLITPTVAATATNIIAVEPLINKPTPYPTTVVTSTTPIAIPVVTSEPLVIVATVGSETAVATPDVALNEHILVQLPTDWISITNQIPYWSLDYFPGALVYWSANNESVSYRLRNYLPLHEDQFLTLFHLDQQTEDPMDELTILLDGFITGTIVYNQVTPIQLGAGLSAAYVDFSVPNGSEEQLFMRAIWLPGGEMNRSWLMVVGGALKNQEQLAKMFNQLTQSVKVRNLESPIESEFMIQVGETITTELIQTTVDWTFLGQKGKFITVIGSPLDEKSDLIISLIDQNGTVLVAIDDAYQGESELLPDYFLTQSGEYTIRIQTNSVLPVAYRLQLIETNELQYGGGGRMDIGDEIDAALPAGEKHHWHFLGEVGTIVTIILDPSSELDMILTFLGADDHELFVLDEGFSGDAELVVGYELPVTGDYEIVISGFNNQGGEYHLSLIEGSEQTGSMFDAGNIQLGETKSQHLFEYEAHIWFFAATEGDRIMIESIPNGGADLELWLLDENAQPLFTRDEKGAGKLEKIGATLPYTGQYLVLIREYSGKEADYQLNLKLLPK